MSLPSALLAYRVLNISNLPNEKQQLAKATLTDMMYENMKKQLKAIEDNSSIQSETNFQTKSEPSFLAEANNEHPTLLSNNSYRNRGRFNNNRRGGNNYSSQGSRQSQSYNSNNGTNSSVSVNRDKWGRKTNPLNSSGKISKCTICQSMYHWFRECPHRVDDDSEEKQIKLTLFNDELYNSYINKFVGETLNHAVLHSRCTKTVCGISWLDNYLETLSPENKEKVVEKQSETKFKFGDGETADSLKSVIIPAQIGNSVIMIQTDVTSNELPLLLSKDAMKKANTKIDFTNDKINILGQEILLEN